MDHGYDTLEICKQVNDLGLEDDENEKEFRPLENVSLSTIPVMINFGDPEPSGGP